MKGLIIMYWYCVFSGLYSADYIKKCCILFAVSAATYFVLGNIIFLFLYYVAADFAINFNYI